MAQNSEMKLFDLLGVPPAGLAIERVEFRLWGKEHLFNLIYNPGVDDWPFQLLFKDCHTYTWSAMADIDDGNAPAEVMGIDLGSDQYRQPATITADVFEVTVGYGELVVQKDW
jgi:hypothetical protein